MADTGEGIAPEHPPHLRERFHPVDAARSAGTGGTGLGLAICRSITEAHGGWRPSRARSAQARRFGSDCFFVRRGRDRRANHPWAFTVERAGKPLPAYPRAAVIARPHSHL